MIMPRLQQPSFLIAFSIIAVITVTYSATERCVAQDVSEETGRGRALVGVYELNATGTDPRIDEIGSTITDAVYISLALIGRYDVSRQDGPIRSSELADLSSTASAHNFDSIIFGSATEVDGGHRITVSVYDRRTASITTTEAVEFFSLFEAFDAADSLVDLLIEEVSGVRVTYGALEIRSATREPYRVEIDGADMGIGFTGSDRIITGNHVVAILQDRGAGESVVERIPIDVEHGETVVVTIDPPWLPPPVHRRLTEIDHRLRALGDRNDRGAESVGLFTEALETLGTRYYREYRPELIERYERWQRVYSVSPTPAPEGASRSFYTGARIALGTELLKTLPGFSDERIRTTLPVRSATYMTARENVDVERSRSIVPGYAELSVDGDKRDWENVPTTISDRREYSAERSVGESGTARDIVWAGVATDGDRIYVAFETADREYNPGHQYYVDFRLASTVRLGWNGSRRYSFMGHVINGDWNNSRWYENRERGFYGAVGDIVEFSVPLDLLERWMEFTLGTCRLAFVVEMDDEPWRKYDDATIDIVVPSVPYLFARE